MTNLPDENSSQEEINKFLDKINEHKELEQRAADIRKTLEKNKKKDQEHIEKMQKLHQEKMDELRKQWDEEIQKISNTYHTSYALRDTLWLTKKIYKPYIPLIVWSLLSFAALFQWWNPIESAKRIKNNNAERTRWVLWHNATITQSVPAHTDTLKLQQVFGGSSFDQVWSIDPEKEKMIIEDLKKQLDQITGTTIEHHLGGIMWIVWKIIDENPTMISHYERPAISIDKIMGTASNEDATWVNSDNIDNKLLAQSRAERIKELLIENMKSINDSSNYDLNIQSIDVDGESINYIDKDIAVLEELAWWGNSEQERMENILSLIKHYNEWSLTPEKKRALDNIIWSKRNVQIKVTTNEHEKIEVFSFDYGLSIWYCMMIWFFLHFLPRMRKNGNRVNEIVWLLREGKPEKEIAQILTEKYNK